MRSAGPPCGDPCSPGSGWTGPQVALRIGKRQAQERLDDTVEQQACQPADKRARGQGSIARTDGHRGGSERGHDPADISRSIGPVSIGKHHQFTWGCQHARAHAKPLACHDWPAMDHAHPRIPGGNGAGHGQSFVGGAVVHDQDLDLPWPMRHSARRAASVPGRRSASLKQGRTKVRPGLEATSVSGLVGPGEPAAAGEPWCRSQLNSCNPRPQPQASQSLVRVVRRSHHPYLGSSGDNAHRGYAARREATRDGVDGCRQPGSLPPGRARQCRRTASAG